MTRGAAVVVKLIEKVTVPFSFVTADSLCVVKVRMEMPR